MGFSLEHEQTNKKRMILTGESVFDIARIEQDDRAMRIARADEQGIADAAERIRSGRLVVFPTETVYGLGARVTDPEAVKRVFAAKKRPAGHPLIAHVLGEEDARTLASEWPAHAHALATHFWPGPLTLIVPRSRRVPDEVTGGLDTVAVRAPSHPVARALIERVGEPIVAPSANMHQRLSPTRAEDVELEEDDVLVLDGGPCARGIESTVIDARSLVVLRPGPISIDAIRAMGLEAVAGDATIEGDAARPSPGMSARHYAPRAQLIVSDEDVPGAVRLELGTDPDEAARTLYARLHDLDARGATIVVVRMPPETEEWRGVRDRIQRASRK